VRTYLDPDGRIHVAAIRRISGRPPLGLHFAEVDGRVELVRLEVGPDLTRPARRDPMPITTTLLRGINLGRLVEEGRRDYLKGIEDIDRALGRSKARALAPRRAAAQASIGRTARGRKPLSEEEIGAAADIYRKAHRGRRPPTKAVAEELGISYPAAVKRVVRARELGMLPATTRGKANVGRSPRRST
jgi:hypothetical protein